MVLQETSEVTRRRSAVMGNQNSAGLRSLLKDFRVWYPDDVTGVRVRNVHDGLSPLEAEDDLRFSLTQVFIHLCAICKIEGERPEYLLQDNRVKRDTAAGGVKAAFSFLDVLLGM